MSGRDANQLAKRTPTVLDLLRRDIGTCWVEMTACPWVLSWSAGQIGCTSVKYTKEKRDA